jgi:starch-binding outer membrane protein, SusD/RagB family
MKFRKTMTLIFTMSLLFMSCKKYLDKKSNQSFEIPTSLDDFQAILDNNNVINEYQSNGIGEISADNYYLSYSVWASFSLQSDKETYIWGPEIFFDNTGTDWQNLYGIAYKANVALDGISGIARTAGNQQAWDNLKGSALFLRAYAFQILVADFSKAYDSVAALSDLGIPLRLTSDFNIPSTRSSVQASYSQIIEDLKLAISLLPTTPVHVMRPSKTSAYALLARVYLSMRDYGEAEAYADSSLQINSTLMDYNLLDTTQTYPIPIFNLEVTFHAIGANTPTYYAIVDSNLIKSYNTNDLRKIIFFNQNADSTYSWRCSYDGTNYDLFVGTATDEMYLTKAECIARLGDPVASLNVLDTLLQKRMRNGTFVPMTANSAADAISIIKSERRKELVWRDLRWTDIKRFNKEGDNIILTRILNGNTYQLQPNDNRYALPLPENVLKLTGMPQNPR